ncbi:MAG TPA: hydrogenase maturation nickel metallochaperone HypA [Baekduia sp.]|uniref:hydrogenase maturation nickel metallochaperone HypA n=1 Tax=Baekduia sp. TaxID=2600305 RepID=UPI002D79CC31|nr:hydrogenase maturation nickel metallochaperone HypA [Baekduia sp.]HET6505418.1 hydrogenase maturation nickel metallochaperone HypA [Baekduia sp.]
MHEFSIASAVVATAVKHADGRRVTVVSLRLGALRQVVPDALAFAFEICARETLCEGARLEWEELPARVRCAPCDRVSTLARLPLRCPACGGGDVAVVGGEELEVESIEVEEGAACTV